MTQSIPKPVHIGKYLDAVYPSYALVAGMQLDLFTALKDGPCTTEQVAGAIGVSATKLRPLLYALVTANLLTVDGMQFANTEEADFFLVRGRPAYLGDICGVVANIWQAVAQTAETIKAGIPQAKLDYSKDELPEEEIASFHGLHKLALISSRDLTAQFDLSGHRHLVDIGGGTGGIAIALTQAIPHLHATVIDLPAVIPIAKEYVERALSKDRIRLVASDVVKNPVEGRYDAAVMRAFTQVLSPEDNSAALKHTFDALEPGGKLYIIARVLDDSRTTPADTALFNLLFLNIYDQGQAYTESEYRTWLGDAGFSDFQRHIQARGDSIIAAARP